MYLVSIYFDDSTHQKIQKYINKVAEYTGNSTMTDGCVPPHITISAFETLDEAKAIKALERAAARLKRDRLSWVSVGAFFPNVIYLTPVLNIYLHEMSKVVYEELLKVDGIKISSYYRPHGWLPHTTIGKKLTEEDMKVAFDVLQKSFGMFEGEVVKMGLAKPNPHRDIATWSLE